MANRFGRAARHHRLTQRMTLREVARQIGITAAYVSDIERGNRAAPRLQMAERWARVINADPRKLGNLALLDRPTVSLALDVSNRDSLRNQVAFALLARWETLTDDDCRRILAAINGNEDTRD